MRDLNFQLKQMCQRNLEGSYATRTARERILALVANQLHGLGFHHLAVQGLKPKHVDALVQRWTTEGLTAGTIKNRMSALRWWAEKIAKQNVVARANDHYGIPERRYVTNESKARVLSTADMEKIADPHLRLSLRFQAAFGLRREESLKIHPAVADRGEVLALQPSWTKGGRAREIPIRSDEQRAVLAEAKRLVGQGSLIPADLTYVAQLRRFEHHCARAAIHRVHGHRHQYAQQRYRELTGCQAPAAGGPRSRELTPGQKAVDREARIVISRELGHEREQVTAIYCGR